MNSVQVYQSVQIVENNHEDFLIKMLGIFIKRIIYFQLFLFFVFLIYSVLLFLPHLAPLVVDNYKNLFDFFTYFNIAPLGEAIDIIIDIINDNNWFCSMTSKPSSNC
uniref:Uncharacterized protein n=1 Tax=Nostoc flagelliforme str. Sunitezuoqi TaxID=676037 RepID=E7DPI6_9NOSO|nr:hypothetical protein Nfla_1701 [Nostoc flagelliforme str. Sunitezuoqi]